jgi:phytoene dehydrogenase-like protein
VHDVIVIGAGPNGLVAAALLAKRGLRTLVLEQRPEAGGAAAESEIAPGFRVPALAHALGPLRKDVIRALAFDKTGVEFVSPDPALTTLDPAGGAIAFHRDAVLTAQSIHRVSAHDAGRWREFLDASHQIAAVFAELNDRPAPAIDDLTRRDIWHLVGTGRHARKLGNANLSRLMRWLPMSIADLTSEWFDADLVKAAIAARALFGHPAGPYSAGTGAMWLQRMAEDPHPVGSGVTVMGGPAALARALVNVAEGAGAQLRTNARVSRITTRNGAAVGVALESGEEIGARAVVSAIDPKQTFLSLMEPSDLPPTFLTRIRNIRARGVTAKINLALSAQPEFSALEGDAVPLRGRLLIAPGLDYLERAFDAAKYGGISPAPWLELAMPSALDPALAPAGAHVLSIAVHCAPRTLREGDWTSTRDTLFETTMATLRAYAPALDSLIIAHETITPEDLERAWGMTGGHIFHGECTLDQWWMARPLLGWSQYTSPIDRLFLCSAGTHPGGGITGASGYFAARVIARDLKKRKD